MARKQKTGPLDAYRTEDRWWRRPNVKLGQPGIIGATSKETGLPVIFKQWPRKDVADDHVLAEIWRDEVRQLHRLVSFPGGRDRLAMLVDAIEAPDSYTLVLAADQRRPLALLLETTTGQFWFRSARTLRSRLRLWQELRRLSQGLEILHGQGLLHRNLDAWSVLTSAGSEPDFLLTGFEWSMRLTATSVPGRSARRQPSGTGAMSFYEDWRALGAIAAQLLGFPSRTRKGEPYQPDISEAALFLYAVERDLLTLLLTADPAKRIDATTVMELLDEAILLLQSQLIGTQPKLVLALQIGRGSRLSEMLREASGDLVDVNVELDQKRFVSDSLAEDPRLVRLKPEEPGAPPRYRLIGRGITYDIQPFLVPATGEESWTVARSIRAWRDAPAHAAIDADLSLDRWEIEIVALAEGARRYGQLQGKTTRWDQLIKEPPSDPLAASRAQATYLALTLVQMVEALILATSIWPVRVCRSVQDGSSVVVTLGPREDRAIESLSQALGLEPSVVRLGAVLSGDQLPAEGEWKLTDEAGLGLRDSEHGVWRVADLTGEGTPAMTIVLEGAGPAPLGEELFLRFGGAGHDSLVRRRLKALKALGDHVELLAMLTDPQGQRRPSHDPWAADEIAERLDPSKAAALEELWSLLPLYLIQGPPGVGKTRLVEELVAKRLAGEPTERLLLTAQSHAAVDHLLEKVKDALEAHPEIDMDQLLAVRCRPRDRDAGLSSWDAGAQAARIANRLAKSPLVAEAPPQLQRGVQSLVRSLSTTPEAAVATHGAARMDRSFEGLLLRSANLVLASTNAQQLERLVEEQARFDWAVVEEAGKATGVELIAPLILSHRRLMIGDHRQLPPYGADSMSQLLQSPGRIKAALEAGRPLIARQLGQLGMDELLDQLCAADLETLAPRARELLLLFESLLARELPEESSSARSGMARRLEHQHRMHPAIAELVSQAFYAGKIKTDATAEARFASDPCPVESVDPARLPDCPILFLDMPFARGQVGMASPERKPRWTNPDEVTAACDALALLRPRDGATPTLKLLSPYRAQVAAMEEAIAQRRKTGELANLDRFVPAGDGFYGTVDSFQGNEADVVLISLVRNNHRVGARALGFLADPRRMNVLVSRARWRLLLVGSWDFLEARFAAGDTSQTSEVAFLRRLLDCITGLEKSFGQQELPQAARIPVAALQERRA